MICGQNMIESVIWYVTLWSSTGRILNNKLRCHGLGHHGLYTLRKQVMNNEFYGSRRLKAWNLEEVECTALIDLRLMSGGGEGSI